METAYYKPSGRTPPTFILFSLILALIGIPILGFLYIYLVYYIPIIYLNIFIAVGCGILLGYLIGLAAKIGKARNPAVVFIITLISVCLLKYFQWCVYIPLVVSEAYGIDPITFEDVSLTLIERINESFKFIPYPASVYRYAVEINYYGVWGIGDSEAYTGGLLLALWICEFLVIAVSAIAASSSQAKFPFSEESDAWYIDTKQRVDADMASDFKLVKDDLENGRFTDFIQFVRSGNTNANAFMFLTFLKPPQDSSSEPYYMTITQSVVNKGKVNTKKLIKNLRIDGSVKDALTSAPPPAQPGEAE